jgi:Lantibiotic dehydratase, C terminus.
MQPATYGQVLQQLVSGIDQPERALAIGRFLDQLIDKGLLALDFAIPEQSSDYLRQLIMRLEPLAHKRVQSLVQQLISLHSALHDYEQLSSAAACYAQSQRIQHILQSIATMLGLEDTWLPAKNLFYENSFLPEVQLACSSAGWQEAEKNLGYLQRLVGLFDPFLPGRLALAAFFVERYGENAEVDLLSFYETFYKESQVAEKQQPTGAVLVMQLFTMPFFTPATSNPALQQVVHWRKRIVQWLSSQPFDANGTRRLPPEELAQMLDECATVWQVPQSLAYYCQIYPDKQRFQLVVNALQSGFGRTRGRLQYIQRNTLTPTQAEQITDDSDPLVVSIQGVFGSNINVRVETTPYEIVYPGQVSMRPQEEQLPLNDLLVSYDAKTQRLSLRSRRLQRTLLPVHLGMMSDYWLPSMYRFLSWAFADAPADPLWGLRLIGMPDTDEDFSEGIRAVPRVFLGNICLYRAHWLVSANAVPRRKKGETDFAYFWRLHCWRQDNALPQQCFIRANAFDFTQRAKFQIDSTDVSTGRIMRKPLYIDFASYFSVLTFEHIAEQCEFGFLLEEALPELETQVVHVEQADYVSEYIFEVEQKR